MTFALSMPAPAPDLVPGDVVLTGDRPTGPLHLGHLAGSLAARLVAQDICDQTLLVADLQALTDHAHDPGKVRGAVVEVAKDYLAVGIDPSRTAIALQSALPGLAELTMLLMTVVGEGRALRNPTVKAEIEAKSFAGGSVPLAFALYPVSQAADILGFGATAVPVGDDQRPMIELAAEMAGRLNAMGGEPVPVPRGVYPAAGAGRLPGTDGRKASKTFGNAVPLGATEGEVRKLVRQMLSDPARKGPRDPGDPDVTVTFAYLRAFDPDREGLLAMDEAYRRGEVGDGQVKERVADCLLRLLAPIRERRARIGEAEALDCLREGTRRASERVDACLDGVRSRFGLRRL